MYTGGTACGLIAAAVFRSVGTPCELNWWRDVARALGGREGPGYRTPVA